ncbi:MAG: DNA-directed RNA polymerase subunit beta' [Chlamydiae bacterium]|nr:DNA-directed RNA polymerase subunit beta' [Chlamydiota bacterium]
MEEHDVQDSPEFDKVTIGIASAELIRSNWSRGEIKKPETINYRTFKPEKGGLFCEKIFGPTKDWECACGKYKKIKHKGIVCDRCGVEVTLSKVRRQRMAHVELAVPVVHIWFFKTMPSRIGNVLGLSGNELEKIVYYEEYIVTDPGDTELTRKQLLNDIEYREAVERFGPGSFVAKMGGEAICDLLKTEDLKSILIELKVKLRKTKSMQARMKLAKRLKIIESFLTSNNNPEWMVMSCVPVIPPDLRPLVPLDGGRFATSDLNDLYRRVINRNNRLKSILKLKTPDVIVRNEKRMLQEAVDALLDNGRHGHPVMGAGNRPLKSLSEMLKGKSGRFRQNLLGKRVDYSGRSVIMVGPSLKFNQCGLPKQMALELFEPFIVKRLKDLGHVYTIRSAKKMIQRQDEVVWDVLEEIIKGHPVLLNRAPTLHRLGIQAFEPTLIEGKAIRIHPLVTKAFNADFDGDQMAVHVPLSIEAQIEAKVLMMAPDNIFLPSSGKPVAMPGQDMTIGLYYLMLDPLYDPEKFGKKVKVFRDIEEVLMALSNADFFSLPTDQEKNPGRYVNTGRGLHIHERIKLRLKSGIIETTPGRVIFNTIVPEELGYQNYSLPSKRTEQLILDCYKKAGLEKTVAFLDALKDTGFREATKGAVSMGFCDIPIPPSKAQMLESGHKRVAQVRKQYDGGIITEGERHSKIISIWTEITDRLSDELFTMLQQPTNCQLNPLFMMLDSGARGNKSQVKQLGALRGLMAKPSGAIIETPITSNFREGLTVLEYSTSSHGARKGLSDTALKTADSGYLTRRLVDVAQEVIVTEFDCETLNGIEVAPIRQGQEELLPLQDRIFGRTVCDNVCQPGDTSKILAKAGDVINHQQAKAIDDAGIDLIKIRSPLTCEAKLGVCTKCYGLNLANGRLIGMGEAIGIIAAQSIGEPGTQLTMRTFHLGGIASASASPELLADKSGILVCEDVRTVENKEGEVLVLNKNGKIHLVKDEGRSLDEYKSLLTTKSIEPQQTFPLELGTKILLEDGASVKMGQKIAQWEQHNIPIICDKPGYVKYVDLVEGLSTEKNVNKRTGQVELVVKQHRGELHPEVAIYADKEHTELVGTYSLPSAAVISVDENEHVTAGFILARIPRGAIKTKDITGGLPRVAELFEARRPKEAAEIAKLDGVIDYKGVQKNKRIIIVRDEVTKMEEEHFIPLTKHLIVQKGDHIVKGEQLTDGLVVPHEILDICGVRELQKYLVNQVQEVYRLQGVDINDKHIEIIVRQMLKKVRISDPGDTTFLYGEDINKKAFHNENIKVLEDGGKPAQAFPILLGITKASLGTDSFLSAASFQDTTRILAEAACEAKTDFLMGFKENIIIGHMIPGGTGYEYHKKVKEHVEKEYEEDLVFDFAN